MSHVLALTLTVKVGLCPICLEGPQRGGVGKKLWARQTGSARYAPARACRRPSTRHDLGRAGESPYVRRDLARAG